MPSNLCGVKVYICILAVHIDKQSQYKNVNFKTLYGVMNETYTIPYQMKCIYFSIAIFL